MYQMKNLRVFPFGFRTLFLALALCLVFLPATASAQGWWWGSTMDSGYDLKTVIDIKGIVTDARFPEQGGGSASLSLRADNEQYTVILGPAWYLKKQGLRVEKGDGLRVTGSRMLDRQGMVYVVAANIANEKTGQGILLRDEDGRPLWRQKGRRDGRGRQGEQQ